MTLTDIVSPRAEIEDHEGNVINKKTEIILRVKLRNKINMKRIDRMIQRKRISLMKVRKRLVFIPFLIINDFPPIFNYFYS